MRKNINFFNRVVIMAIVCMILTEWFWSNSYMYDEAACYVIWWAFAIDIGYKGGKKIGDKISGFIKKHWK